MKVLKSDYIKYSRTIVRKLHVAGCYGVGSMYEDHVLSGLPEKFVSRQVLKALVKQRIVCVKKKKFGSKYYLNRDRQEKIAEILKEKGKRSVIPVLLML